MQDDFHPVSEKLEENKKRYEAIYENCDDIKKIDITLSGGRKVFLAYEEVTLASGNLGATAVGVFLEWLEKKEGSNQELSEAILENEGRISDYRIYDNIEEAAQGMLTGDSILFVDGVPYGIKISDKGFPGIGVSSCESEKVVRGSNEGFSESVKTNVALVRKRVRSTRVKVKSYTMGVRSHTLVNVLYIEDLAYPSVVRELDRRMKEYLVDGVLDSGVIEQLAEESWLSPFPQFQTTQRPDKAAFSLLEGRVVVLSDNSPVALILPCDYNSFLKTTDDYYNRWDMATFARILRFFSSFFAMTLPGLYLALTNFHTQILPTSLLLAFQEAREGVPFPTVLEVLLMELSFELLREAGVRLPGAMGSTIGIVGGLIIGQAAVEAHLVSPIVVILVSFTALCSFAIPSEEFAYAFRVLKFLVIFASAWLGYFGFLVCITGILFHLARLKSFGIPYLTPFSGGDINGDLDKRDALWRYPLQKNTVRPIYARRNQRVRLRRKKKKIVDSKR